MAEPGTGSTQIVWSDYTDAAAFSRFANYGPNYFCCKPVTSNFSCLAYSAEEIPIPEFRSLCPRIDD
jgi:hypothetical protein